MLEFSKVMLNGSSSCRRCRGKLERGQSYPTASYASKEFVRTDRYHAECFRQMIDEYHARMRAIVDPPSLQDAL